MNDILSKEEIEALTAHKEDTVLQSKGKIVKSYDFSAAKRFSKEHLRLFQIFMDDFCYRLKNYLSLRLRIDIDVKIISIKQAIFKDFLSLPSPTFVSIFSMKPLEGNAAIEIDPVFLIYLMEYLLGSENKATEPVRRQLTSIEIETASALTNKILTCFKEAFVREVKFDIQIESTESNPQFVTIASANEAALYLSLEIRLKQITGTLNICFPYLVLESLIPHLSIKKWFMYAQKKSSVLSEEMMKKHLDDVELNLVCLLGNCNLSFQELCSLNEGDYLRLDTSRDSLLPLQISGSTKFLGQLGLAGNHMALKVVSVVE